MWGYIGTWKGLQGVEADGGLTDKWRCRASKYTKLNGSLEAGNQTEYVSHKLVTMAIP